MSFHGVQDAREPVIVVMGIEIDVVRAGDVVTVADDMTVHIDARLHARLQVREKYAGHYTILRTVSTLRLELRLFDACRFPLESRNIASILVSVANVATPASDSHSFRKRTFSRFALRCSALPGDHKTPHADPVRP
jgi:hypothetical protein